MANILRGALFAGLIIAGQAGEASAQSKWTGLSLGVGIGAGAIYQVPRYFTWVA